MRNPTPPITTPKPTTTHTEAQAAAPGAAEPPQPVAEKKKGKPGRKKTKVADGEERVVSLGMPEDLLKKVRVLSALTGESISSMVVSALASKVRRELKAAVSALDD